MFEENINAIKRMTEEDTVYLAVVCSFVRQETLMARNMIVACCDEPMGPVDFSILSCIDAPARVQDVHPTIQRYGATPLNNARRGDMMSSLRGYATMLTVMGIKVYMPIRKSYSSKRKGGSLVVKNPGIGGEAVYESSYDKAAHEKEFTFFEFDPTNKEQFNYSIPIISAKDFVKSFDSLAYDVDLNRFFHDHEDSEYWQQMMGDSYSPEELKLKIEQEKLKELQDTLFLVQNNMISQEQAMNKITSTSKTLDEILKETFGRNQ